MALVQFRGVSFTTLTGYTSSAAGAPLATLYSDPPGTLPLPNPFAAFGQYTLYALAGTYLVQGDLSRVVATGMVRTADPSPAEDNSWWVIYTGTALVIRGRISGVTYTIATVPVP